MKRIIFISLVFVLVLGAFGGLAYAQQQPSNKVHLSFYTRYHYNAPGDSFSDTKVTGSKDWYSQLLNIQDAPGEPGGMVDNATLTLVGEESFDKVTPEPMTMNPPTYEWSFGSIPPIEMRRVEVGFYGLLDDFTPGLNVSRSVDQSVFSESGTQPLHVSVTAVEEFVSFSIHIIVLEDEYVNPTISGEHELIISEIDPVVDEEYNYDFDIDIELKAGVEEVEFMPLVRVMGLVEVDSGTTTDSSFAYDMKEVGEWTWSAEGSYDYIWREIELKAVQFASFSRGVVEPISHEPMVGQKLVGIGRLGRTTTPRGTELTFLPRFDFTNPDCVGGITIDRISIIRHDGVVIYEGPLLELVRDERDGVVDEIPVTDIGPHRIWIIALQQFMKDPETSRWLTSSEALDLPLSSYTMEISWTGEIDGLPLTGWVQEQQTAIYEGVPEWSLGYAKQMVNMEQVLEP